MVDFEVGTSSLVRTWANSGTKVNTDSTLVGGVPKTNIGWQPQEKPPSQYFNFQMNQLGQKINHCLQNGVPLWNATTAYTAGNAVGYTNSVWLCVTGNTNSAPTLLNSNWVKMTQKTELDAQTLTMLKLMTTPVGVPVSIPTVTTLQVPAGLKVPNDGRTDLIEFNSNITVDVSSGTGLNKLDTGTIQANSVYYLWLLKNPTTSTVGAVLSLSSTSPTLPSGMSLKRLYPVDFQTDSSGLLIVKQLISHNSALFNNPYSVHNGGLTSNDASPQTLNLTTVLGVNSVSATFEFFDIPDGGQSGQLLFYPFEATNYTYGTANVVRLDQVADTNSAELIVNSTRSYKMCRQFTLQTSIKLQKINYGMMS